MNLMRLMERTLPLIAWQEGDNIPWNDPEFSPRMLMEHLSQGHDWASRRLETIDEYVGWLNHQLLGGKAGTERDLG